MLEGQECHRFRLTDGLDLFMGHTIHILDVDTLEFSEFEGQCVKGSGGDEILGRTACIPMT